MSGGPRDDRRPASVDSGAVVTFWRDAGPDRWFAKDAGFDAAFRVRFLAQHEAAARGECDHWMDTATGALGLILLLDQFPRNAFRGTARMYATDPLALRIADRALAVDFDQQVPADLRLFFYLPFAHSESLADQDRSVELNRRLGAPYIDHAMDHREIIRRFGRFPHRNALLGRATRPDEQAFLGAGGFAG
ncbi:MAG: DUF924 family protein [Burkholderiales bacterium]|nr:DUF924 family protein [Burkholderiales bacterium]